MSTREVLRILFIWMIVFGLLALLAALKVL